MNKEVEALIAWEKFVMSLSQLSNHWTGIWIQVTFFEKTSLCSTHDQKYFWSSDLSNTPSSLSVKQKIRHQCSTRNYRKAKFTQEKWKRAQGVGYCILWLPDPAKQTQFSETPLVRVGPGSRRETQLEPQGLFREQSRELFWKLLLPKVKNYFLRMVLS